MLKLAALIGVLALASGLPADSVFQVPLQDGSFQAMTGAEIQRVQLEEELNPTYTPLTDVVFHLYSKKHEKSGEIVKINDANSLRQSSFDPSLPTIFLVHGWIFDINIFFIQEAKEEYLKKGLYNVFGVDWSKGGGTSNYILARGRVKSTGELIGQFIRFLETEGKANLRDVTLVGYSLGAHVVGNCGKFLGGKVPEIVGLDPAGPLFLVTDSDRLVPACGEFVEVIHSNTASNGFTNPIGHADFYPNGGATQPGCPDHSCSHDRAPYYFIESINSKTGFVGKGCKTFSSMKADGCDFDGTQKKMGGAPLTRGSGVFHFATHSTKPFSKN